MSNIFSAQELADFYQQVADGGEIGYYSHNLWVLCPCNTRGPKIGSPKDVWRIKPTQKVIDLSVLIDSQIDCEFKDDISERTTIGKLLEITNGDYYPYTTGNSADKYYGQCQPRIYHKHAWLGGECPLPEGFMVKVTFRNAKLAIGDEVVADELYWRRMGSDLDIIAFEVLGLADGYVMPWEQDNG
tara:strand:+ start:76 stop:633 length:558 start_codon:yes stop_codon:yes gene_type:complete